MTMSTAGAGEEHLPKPGEVLNGKYRIERVIGKGGMGAVLAAHHLMLDQPIAIKFLLGEIAQNEEARRRFLNEGKNAFKIKSEHVCRIFDFGEENGMPYMVMEFLDGEDLSQMLEKRGALPVEEAVDYVLQALEAIAQAHALGIVHRDLKPANLFLHRNTDSSTIVKVLDFGIAKAASNPFGETGGHNLTSTKSMLGSPLYMSPEQLRSAKSVDARADIWALGVILYELLTGTVPFNGETLGELFIAILEQPPPPVSHKRPDVPQVLSDAIMRCLQRNVDTRFMNVAELAAGIAPCAPARSYVSIERVTQALGLPKPNVVMPGAGSMPDQRISSGQYANAQPQQFSASQSGPRPQQFSSSNSGVHQFQPPQGGTQMLGSQTNSAWGNTGGAPPQKSKAPLILGLAGGVVVIGALITGAVVLKAHNAASTVTPPVTSVTDPKPDTTETAKTPDPSTTTTATTTSTAANTTTAAPTASATATTATTLAGLHTSAGGYPPHTGGGNGKVNPVTTTTTTTTPTAHPTATGAFNPLTMERRNN
jgi:serine/threonine-protein kinase